ncbi:MAG: hypothetical protein FK733_14180 [Asgard group archaeon]|nr:hypothetical protein [Asgard group archaeon]
MSEDSQDPSEQLIHYFFMLTEKQLKDRYNENKAKQISQKFQQIFMKLIKKYDDDKVVKNDAINPIFLIALNESQQISREELLDQMLKVYEEMLTEILINHQLGMATSDDPWKTFVTSTKSANKQLYENEYFQCKTVIDDEQQFGFDINRCIYYEIFKENGQEDLAPLLCEYDFILADNVKDWVVFTRDETIADGSHRCAFRYFKKTAE